MVFSCSLFLATLNSMVGIPNIVLSKHISIWHGHLHYLQRILLFFKRPPNGLYVVFAQPAHQERSFLPQCLWPPLSLQVHRLIRHTDQMELVLPISLKAECLGFKRRRKKGIPMPAKRSLHPEPSYQSAFFWSPISGRSRLGTRAPEQGCNRVGQGFDHQFPS